MAFLRITALVFPALALAAAAPAHARPELAQAAAQAPLSRAPCVAITQSEFALAGPGAVPPASIEAVSEAASREAAARESGGRLEERFRNVTVGPSWSYQSPRSGAIIEMGALGGGVVEDRPRLAHVAFAWQF